MPELNLYFLNDTSYPDATYGPPFTFVGDVNALKYTIFCSVDCEFGFRWSVDNQFQVISTDTYQLTGGNEESILVPITARYVQIFVNNIASNPCDLKVQVFFLNKDPIQYQSIPIVANTLSLLKTNVNSQFDVMENKIIDSFNKAQQRDSGWEFNKIESFQLRVVDGQSLKGSSYCPNPEKINLTKAVINIKNTKDDECFKWVVMRSDYPKEKNPQRINDLQKIWKTNPSLYNFDGIGFPVQLSDIPRFEKLNNRYVNVIGCKENGDTYPLYLSSEPWNATDVLLYNEHFSLIKNFNKLNASLTKHQHKLFVCQCCCHAHFSTQEKLDKHYEICKTFDSTRIIMPSEKNKYCEFKDYNKQMRDNQISKSFTISVRYGCCF